MSTADRAPRVGARARASNIGWSVAAVVAIASTPVSLAAQRAEAACRIELSSPDFVGAATDLSRVLDLLGSEPRYSFTIRRPSDGPAFDACNVPAALGRLSRSLASPAAPARGAVVLPPHIRIVSNGAYPRDWHDGVQWSGRGVSASFIPGVLLRWNWFEAAVVPILTGSMNSSFLMHPYPDSTAYSRFIDRWHGRFIDLPQRFGPRSQQRLDAGHSYARVHVAGWRAGVSNENLSWGPARRNPLLLSGTAGGFPHVFVETARPNNVVIGTAELQLFWGRLSESDYFDHEPANDRRALAGIVATFRPHGLDGLYVGAARLHSQTWGADMSAQDLLLRPYTGVPLDSSGFPRDLRLYALFMRWVAAPGGFEVYGEWARQDEWRHWFRLVNELDAPQAYTVGLQKVVRRGANAVRFAAEISHLADALPHRDVGRGLTSFYISPHVAQGHTHRGQLLGAPIGPGSEAQFIGTDVFWSAGRTGLSIERVRYDDDAYYAVWGQFTGPHGHDTELSFRANHVLALRTFAVEAELGYSVRHSRDFHGLGRAHLPDRRDTNVTLLLSGRWNLPRWSWER